MDFSLTGVVTKVLNLYKVFGFYPISIVDKKSVTKPLDVFLFIMGLSIGAYICYFSICNREAMSTSTSYIANTGSFFVFISAIVIAMISMICAAVFGHKIWAAAVKLEGVEYKVRAKGFCEF